MKITSEILYRQAEIRAGDWDKDKRTVLLSFSSEHPVDRVFGKEVLDHGAESVRLERLNESGSLLINHNIDDQVGTVERAWITNDRKGKAVVRFSRSVRGEEIFQDVQDRIRKTVSFAYRIYKMVEGERNNETFYKAVDWEPLEISLTPLPADPTVGIGRKAEEQFEIEILENTRGVKMNPAEQERNRILEITAIGEKTGMSDIANQYIESGKSIEEFRKAVLEKMDSKIIPIDSSASVQSGLIGMSGQEIRQFSFLKLIRGLVDIKEGRRPTEPIDLEIECSRAVEKLKGRAPQGLFIPADVLRVPLQRDLLVGTATAGGHLVATELLSSSFIELLRNRMIVRRLGAIILGDLQGFVDIPGQSDGATAFWVGENVNLTESQQVFRQLELEPHTVGGFTDISRRMLIQSSMDIEALVRSDLARTIAQEVDRAALNGSGLGAQPLGLLNTAGIGTANWNAANPLSTVVELETDVAVGNADFGALRYCACAKVRGILKQTFTNATYGEIPMWKNIKIDKDLVVGELNGYEAMVSNQLPDNLTSSGESGSTSQSGANRGILVYGNWNDLVIAEWSGIDILVDPYTGGTAGRLRIIVFQDVDFGVRNVESFSYCADIPCP